MTPARQPHPQRCHICGAEMSHENPEICKNFHVQQATHTSTPAPIVKEVRDNLCVICQDSLKAHDAQVAKAAREQVLDDAQSLFENSILVLYNGKHVQILLESLRAQQQEQP